MNRKIKFNAWDKVEKRELKWETISCNAFFLADVLLNAARYEVLQSTGVFDRNMKEVYEGDILKGNITAGLPSYLYIVKYLGGSFCACLDGRCYPLTVENLRFLEIIGDIYQTSIF